MKNYDMDEEEDLVEVEVQFTLKFIPSKQESSPDKLSVIARWGRFHVDFTVPIVDYKNEEDFITNRTREYQWMKNEALLLLNAKVNDASMIQRNLRRHPKHENEYEDE